MNITFKRDGNSGWIKLYINGDFIKTIRMTKKEFLNNNINIKQIQIHYKKEVNENGKILKDWIEEEDIFEYTIKR